MEAAEILNAHMFRSLFCLLAAVLLLVQSACSG